MVIEKRTLDVIWPSLAGRLSCRVTHSPGSAGLVGSGNDRLARDKRRAYLLGGRMATPLPAGTYGVSVITEMELLAWPSLTTKEEQTVRAFLGQLVICELTPAIRARAVSLRKVERLKLPDAVVC